MTTDEQAAATVRATYNRIAAEGLKSTAVAGATDEQIDRWVNEQGALRAPAALREVLRLIGVRHGLWLRGSSFGIDEVSEKSKAYALGALSQLDIPLTDPRGMLVIVEHQSYSFHVIDGVDLNSSDPGVWAITEGELVEQAWPSVTSWFDSVSPKIGDYRSRLRLMRRLGKRNLPDWAEQIELNGP